MAVYWVCAVGVAVIAAGCRSTRPAPPQPRASGAERLADAAHRRFEAGSPEEAVRYYRAALDAAMAADASAEIVRLASGLAVSLAAAGQWPEALRMARLAGVEAPPATVERWTAVLIEARVLRLLGNPDAADRLIDQVWAAPGTVRYPLVRAEAGILSAEAALRRGQPRDAAERLRAASALLPPDTPFSLRAAAEGVAGRLALADGEAADAAAAFDREAAGWRDAGRIVEMAAALEAAGHAWRTAQRPRDAADRYVRAGRGLQAAGRRPAAIRLLRLALESATLADDPELVRRIELWHAMIEERAPHP